VSIRCSSDFGWQLMVDPWDVRGKDCVCAPVLLVDGAVRPGWSHCVGGGLPHCQQQLAVVLFMATPVESIQLLSTCAPCSFAPYRLGAIVWAMHTAGVSMAHTLAWLEIVTHDREWLQTVAQGWGVCNTVRCSHNMALHTADVCGQHATSQLCS